jgi:hypothetical protein
MATERQLRANRENAKQSTGPKTAGGRARSSRNALSHGLSLPLTLDAEAAAKAGLIRQMLVSEPTEPSRGWRPSRSGKPSLTCYASALSVGK